MIAIIDYDMGNVGSVRNMLKRIGYDAQITKDINQIKQADKIILPGVGAYDTGMKHLNESGLRECIEEQVHEKKIPILGICLGMQLLMESSDEGEIPGLGWIKGKCVKFSFPEDTNLKVPHMGWNYVRKNGESKLTNGIQEKDRFYFVHSYHAVCDNPENTLLYTTYGHEFSAAVGRGNVYGTQFHPEKSHVYGMKVLEAFCKL